MSEKVSYIGEDAKTKYSPTRKDSKTYQDMMNKLDELDEAHNKLVKTSRLRGFTEGCLATFGVMAIGGLVITAITKNDK